MLVFRLVPITSAIFIIRWHSLSVSSSQPGGFLSWRTQTGAAQCGYFSRPHNCDSGSQPGGNLPDYARQDNTGNLPFDAPLPDYAIQDRKIEINSARTNPGTSAAKIDPSDFKRCIKSIIGELTINRRIKISLCAVEN
jgi:hypothetical protein